MNFSYLSQSHWGAGEGRKGGWGEWKRKLSHFRNNEKFIFWKMKWKTDFHKNWRCKIVVCLSVCLSVCLCVHLPLCLTLPVCLSIRRLSVCIFFICFFVHLSYVLRVFLCVHFYLSSCLSLHLSVCHKKPLSELRSLFRGHASPDTTMWRISSFPGLGRHGYVNMSTVPTSTTTPNYATLTPTRPILQGETTFSPKP
jgi:hypothetical protein